MRENGRAARIAMLAGVLLIAAVTASAQQTRFLIETIRVEGLRFGSDAIVIAESRLVPGRAYGEPQLRDALSRIQRLPFVLRADFALRRGSARDRYVLVVTIDEMKPLFLDYGVLNESIGGWPRGVITNSDVYRHNEEYPNFGARLFPGSRSMILATVDAHGDDHFVTDPVYGISFTQYDLFGTRAVASASVRYREQSLDLSGFGLQGRTGLTFGDHLRWDFSLAVPLSGGNQAIRAEWHRAYGETTTGPDRNSVLTQFHGDNVALAWIYDSTNDLLFPTRGTYGQVLAQTLSRVSVVRVRGVPFTTELQTDWRQSGEVQATHYIPITAVQSVVVTGDALLIPGFQDVFRARVGYTATRQLVSARAGWAALHFETGVEHVMPYHETNVTAGVAARNAWGVLHFDFSYLNIGGHSP